jgi:hypothetical protein
MAESITEMIIPGTYIDVRAEGLIGVGGIATGNVGIAGTAAKGEVNEVKILSSFAEARDVFGEYDAWVNGSSGELTLVRALQQIFANGASTVYAVRTAATGYAAASRALIDTTGTVVTITSGSPGSWGHDIKVQVKAASQNGFRSFTTRACEYRRITPKCHQGHKRRHRADFSSQARNDWSSRSWQSACCPGWRAYFSSR